MTEDTAPAQGTRSHVSHQLEILEYWSIKGALVNQSGNMQVNP